MKKISIVTTFVFFLIGSMAFAQRNQDSIEAENKQTKAKTESTLTTVDKETVFGYHHNNYKHHAKAKKAGKWFKVQGHVNKSAAVTNYKMPFTEEKIVEKTIVEESKTQQRSRNYKRPYSAN